LITSAKGFSGESAAAFAAAPAAALAPVLVPAEAAGGVAAAAPAVAPDVAPVAAADAATGVAADGFAAAAPGAVVAAGRVAQAASTSDIAQAGAMAARCLVSLVLLVEQAIGLNSGFMVGASLREWNRKNRRVDAGAAGIAKTKTSRNARRSLCAFWIVVRQKPPQRAGA